jgi:hypothetical protein
MIHQIVLSGFHTARRTKVHPIRLARLLDLLIFARQANEVRMEFFQVFLEHLWIVARRVAGDHEREEHAAAFRNNFVVHEGHFVEFVGTDIGAVREAEVDLMKFPSVCRFNRGGRVVEDVQASICLACPHW